jgi:hypothetical protein
MKVGQIKLYSLIYSNYHEGSRPKGLTSAYHLDKSRSKGLTAADDDSQG